MGPSGGLADVVLADAIVAPPEEDADFGEPVWRLPACYFFAEPTLLADPADVPVLPSRADWGLPRAGFVLCAFHGAFKIDAPAFAAWMRILRAVPGAVLWLLARPAPAHGPARSDPARAAMAREAAALGVDPQRIVWAPRVAKRVHIARQRLADMYLDAFHCGGHTSLLDALLAGVPTVTLRGDRWATRVGASMLTTAALPELIAATPKVASRTTIFPNMQDYENIVVGLLQDPVGLSRLRTRVAGIGQSALLNASAFVSHLEHAYRALTCPD